MRGPAPPCCVLRTRAHQGSKYPRRSANCHSRGLGTVGPQYSSLQSNGKNTHSRRDRLMIQRNTLHQTKASWSANAFGAFVALFYLGIQVKFHVRSTTAHDGKTKEGQFVRTPNENHYRALGGNCFLEPRSIQMTSIGAQLPLFTTVHRHDQRRPSQETFGRLFSQYSHTGRCRW